MKENEAPEKIYITNYDIEALPKNEQLSERWHEVSTKDTDIEYVRTDAFIEKACKFLYKYNKKQVQKPSPKATLGYSGHTINVDEFRKYMKGE